MSSSLRCESVSKAFGSRPVLSGIDLEVPAGTLTAILGASGSGKTTLLRVVAGFEEADSGRVTVGGRVVEGSGVHLAPERRGIGYVAQEGALFPHLSVAENVLFGLDRRSRKSSTRAAEVLELVGLAADFALRRPQELSGGEQRRVALARALAPDPSLIVLDEPFSGLDAASRGETRQAVLGALGASGTTALLVTHDQAEALSTGREVAVLRSGVLVQTATPSELYRHPVDIEVARFVGEAVVLAGEGKAGSVECALGVLACDPCAEGPVAVMIRPEQISIARGDSGVSQVRATVAGITFYGPHLTVELVVKRSEGSEVTVLARAGGEDVPAPGDEVGISVVGKVRSYPARR